jgi:hypothetical protein
VLTEQRRERAYNDEALTCLAFFVDRRFYTLSAGKYSLNVA